MEQILQMVSGSELFSLLDGFSGYNQVLVAKEDRLKTTFKQSGELLLTEECPLDSSTLELLSRGLWI